MDGPLPDPEPPDGERRLATLLSDLGARLLDARKGYRQAAEQIDNDELRALFRYNAEMRDSFEAELAEVRAERGHPGEDHMSASGALHAFWNALRELIRTNDPVRILDECERWEERAVKAYKSVLDDRAVPPNVKEILERQKQRIEAEVDHIRQTKLNLGSPEEE